MALSKVVKSGSDEIMILDQINNGLKKKLRGKYSRFVVSIIILCMFIMCFELVWMPFTSSDNTVEDPSPAKMFRDRKSHLEEMCSKHPEYLKQTTRELLTNTSQPSNFSKFQMEHMYVDVKHRAMYCYVPKVGCTNWKRLFMILTGRSKAAQPMDIRADEVHSYRKYGFSRLSYFFNVLETH